MEFFWVITLYYGKKNHMILSVSGSPCGFSVCLIEVYLVKVFISDVCFCGD